MWTIYIHSTYNLQASQKMTRMSGGQKKVPKPTRGGFGFAPVRGSHGSLRHPARQNPNNGPFFLSPFGSTVRYGVRDFLLKMVHNPGDVWHPAWVNLIHQKIQCFEWIFIEDGEVSSISCKTVPLDCHEVNYTNINGILLGWSLNMT